MELHPEQSSGEIVNGLPDTQTTEVTTSLMVREGTTVVIGGLIDEQLEESRTQIPVLGSIPVVGNAFRNKDEKIVRNELIVLITPRIVREPEAAAEGEAIRDESERQWEYFSNKLAPGNRRNLARMHFERAVFHFEKGNLMRARHYAKQALRVRKNYRDALLLLDQIDVLEEKRPWYSPPWTPVETDPQTMPPDELHGEPGPALDHATAQPVDRR
jgi:hypothetical protein